MTIRAKLDYSLSTWGNCQPISTLIIEEYDQLWESIRAGHNVQQLLVMPGDDVFLMRNAVNSFSINSIDLLLTMCPQRRLITVREYPSMHLQLLRLYSEDAKFRELVAKGDLPSVVRWRTDYADS
jgi:hypothetical protein